ncbi:MAG: hypothetical protein K9K67_16085 [Bacteriovoracaceae bacterium]|nr:hypothetical protein [Bacteriovoracaceae bacterium]
MKNLEDNPTLHWKERLFEESRLGKKLLFSILFFSTILTLFLTSIQIYIDYNQGIKSIYTTVDQIRATQLESLAQNLWNINEEQIQIQLKGLLEIETIKGLKIYPIDDKPISIIKKGPGRSDIISNYPIIYSRKGINTQLGTFEIISDLTPVLKTLQSRVLIILLSQGTKTFIVSFFILFIFNILVNKNLLKINRFAREMSLDNIDKRLDLSRGPNEDRDEIDDLSDSLNLMQEKIQNEIQQKRKYQEQLLQSQKMEALGTLASGVAHDFNNILQGLYNALFILEEEVIDNADALNHLQTANTYVDRARELVKQILIYTKHEEGAFQKFSAIPPIQDVVNILRSAKSNNVTISLFVDPPQGNIYGDKTQLKQILLNLGNNALHALEDQKNGQIKIRVSSIFLKPNNDLQLKAGPYLKLVVEDNGPGISSNIINKVFEPFFTTKEIDKGTGLGLSVVQGIVHRHLGEIQIESTEDLGTKFKVFLPLIDKEEAHSIKEYNGKEKIILVSNEAILSGHLHESIFNLEHELVIFKSAADALNFIKLQKIDNLILIVDDFIEQFSPVELIRKVRQLTKTLPILYLSNKGTIIPINLKAYCENRSSLLSSKGLNLERLKENLKESSNIVG